MLEYKVLSVDGLLEKTVEKMLNIYILEGWRYVGSVSSFIILERERIPEVQESDSEGIHTVSYSWKIKS